MLLVVGDELGRRPVRRILGHGLQPLAVKGEIRLAVVELGLDAAAHLDVQVVGEREVAAVEELVQVGAEQEAVAQIMLSCVLD